MGSSGSKHASTGDGASHASSAVPSARMPSNRSSIGLNEFVTRLRATLLHKFPSLVRGNRQQQHLCLRDSSTAVAAAVPVGTVSAADVPQFVVDSNHNYCPSTVSNTHRSNPVSREDSVRSYSRDRDNSSRIREYFDPRVLEKYDIRALVGKGSFSRVVRAVNRTTKHECAIKMIDTRILASKAMENELAILAKLSHPFIISLIEIFHSSRRVYMVMELATGGELYDKIITRGSFGELDTAVCIKMILEGLSYLHDNGITHRLV